MAFELRYRQIKWPIERNFSLIEPSVCLINGKRKSMLHAVMSSVLIVLLYQQALSHSVAWTTVINDDGLERQINIGRFTIKRNIGSKNLNHGHDPKRRWSITGRSSYEYSIMDWGTEGQVWQVCIDNPRMGIKQHDYVTLHNAMVPVGMHPYLEGLRQ